MVEFREWLEVYLQGLLEIRPVWGHVYCNLLSTDHEEDVLNSKWNLGMVFNIYRPYLPTYLGMALYLQSRVLQLVRRPAFRIEGVFKSQHWPRSG